MRGSGGEDLDSTHPSAGHQLLPAVPWISPCHQVCHRTVPCWGPAPGGSREHRGGRWELLRARPGDTGDALTGSGLIDGKVPVTAPLGLSPDGFKVLQSQPSPLCSQNAQGESSDKWQKN